MTYYVPSGNWTANVISDTELTNPIGVFPYEINLDSTTDPAVGCSKDFTATYKCGLSSTAKDLLVSKSADGRTARFDCAEDFAKCNDIKLTLTDDGKLTLTNLAGNKKYWDSTTSGHPTITSDNIIPAGTVRFSADTMSGKALTIPANAAVNGKTKVNYLLATQFLAPGEWIGSPSGTCRLMMMSSGALQVVTTVFNCDSLDTVNDPQNDAISARLYTIENIHNENIGKAAYVNNKGQLQLYPAATMTYYGDSFESVGNYGLSGAKIGTPTTVSNLNACETLCTPTQDCAGFIFSNANKTCQLLDNTMYSQNRIIDPTKQYFVRTKFIGNNDQSCPSDPTNPVTLQTASFWQGSTYSTNMTPTTKCGLASFTEAERAAVAGDLPVLTGNLEYKDTAGRKMNIDYVDISGNPNVSRTGFKYMYETLQDKYTRIKDMLFDTNTSVEAKFAELQDSRQNLADWTGEQLQNLEAMNEDRDLNMMSQNYRHILWSILAIVIIIATMKFTKSVAAKAAAT